MPEQQSRGLFTPSPAGEGDVQQQEAAEGGGFRAAAAGLAGKMFGVSERLPAFEEAARQLVHPLFEQLKTQVGPSAHLDSSVGSLYVACLEQWWLVTSSSRA